MLLPSDVARLVLGYLQEEGLCATSQAFIHESPNLKEYADHTTGDGTIPACMFSVFGKGLTTILNEYVAAKTKESRPEIPAVMTSLWKKLDFTLNQIKSLQNTNAFSSNQRTRSRIGVANMARQRSLTVTTSSGAIVSTSITEASAIVSPAPTPGSVLSHSTPVSCTPLQSRAAAATCSSTQQLIADVRLNPPRDLPVQMVISEQKLGSGPLSPGRRKWDTPRKRGGPLSGSSGTTRFSSSTSAEPQLEEVVDENFPQLVIQNARDKILGDRLLQEKLAENINKILSSDPMPQTSKGPLSTVEAEQSIDEILGLQGELHMSDDAIHDILEQTESDPAFQALYDLFDYTKTRLTDGDPADGDNGSTQEVGKAAAALPPAGLVSAVRELPSEEPDASASEITPTTVKGKTAQERKIRKSATLLKKTVLGPKGCSSRIEKSSATLLVSHCGHQGASSTADTRKKERGRSLSRNRGSTSPMDVDEPLQSPHPPTDILVAPQAAGAESSTGPPLVEEPVSSSSQPPSSGDSQQQQNVSIQPVFLPPAPVVPDNAPIATSLPQFSPSVGETPQLPPADKSVSPTSASAAAALTLTSDSPKAISTSAPTTMAAHAASSDAPSSSATSDKAAADPSIVSLKIIITDNQEEEPSSDPALARAVSSISGDKIPTIYLTSPARTSTALVSGTPKSSLDETAQAVSGLQNSEVQASPLGGRAAPLPETPQVQQNYIIQLPLDTGTPTGPGGAASYFLVTEPPGTEGQVLLSAGAHSGQPLPIGQYGIAQACPQGFSPGSRLILPSPAKSVMLPVSVMGQNAVGRVQMVSKQLVTVPNAVAVPPAEAVNSKSPTVAIQWSTAAGTEPHLVSKLVKNVAQQDTPAAAKHKRILCFDSPVDIQPQTAKTTVATTSSSLNPAAKNLPSLRPAKQTQRNSKGAVVRTRPNILGGNRPKRRIQTVRCTVSPQTNFGLAKEVPKATTPTQKHHGSAVKQNSNPNSHSVHDQKSQPAGGSGADEASEKNPSLEKVRPDKDGVASDSEGAVNSGSRPEKDDTRKEPQVKQREGRSEKRGSATQEGPNVTANKENEIKGCVRELQLPTPSSSSRDFSPESGTQAASTPQGPKASKPSSKTSSLAKQAAEMLHDIQALNSPSPSPLRAPTANPELSPAVRSQEEAPAAPADCLRTPSRHKRAKEGGEGTPRHLIPPNTPDVPTCSPASEAGSENSINMAAHTLMILSRAAIARSGTPLKDSLRQDGAEKKSPAGVKVSKKRKLSSPTAVSPAKKEREKKKLMDCFPHDLDVDKFLSSLHYDE